MAELGFKPYISHATKSYMRSVLCVSTAICTKGYFWKGTLYSCMKWHGVDRLYALYLPCNVHYIHYDEPKSSLLRRLWGFLINIGFDTCPLKIQSQISKREILINFDILWSTTGTAAWFALIGFLFFFCNPLYDNFVRYLVSIMECCV